MRKILIASLVLGALGASASALAQVAGPAGGLPKAPPATGGRLKEMAKLNEEILAKLDLTPDQKAKIDAHQKEMATKRRELAKAAKGGDADAKAKMQALRKENQEFAKQTLTKDQMKRLRELRLEAMKEMQKVPAAPAVKP